MILLNSFLGFWSKKEKEKVIKIIKKGLPKNIIIEEIGFFTAKKERKNVYEIYVRIADKNKRHDLKYDRWEYRTNGTFRFDIKKMETDMFIDDIVKDLLNKTSANCGKEKLNKLIKDKI